MYLFHHLAYFKGEDELKQKFEDKEQKWMERVQDMSKQHRIELEKVHWFLSKLFQVT